MVGAWEARSWSLHVLTLNATQCGGTRSAALFVSPDRIPSCTCIALRTPSCLLAGSGTIDIKELKTALTALGQSPSDEELFVMISQACAGFQDFSSLHAPVLMPHALHVLPG